MLWQEDASFPVAAGASRKTQNLWRRRAAKWPRVEVRAAYLSQHRRKDGEPSFRGTAKGSHPACRRLRLAVRGYLTAVLPGLAVLPVQPVPRLTRVARPLQPP